ncbi:MAG: TonB-dependent receptor [Chitinophagaceae bacterium]|nr:TonB-dependent receptor [Chitinophagaceae bacterium]
MKKFIPSILIICIFCCTSIAGSAQNTTINGAVKSASNGEAVVQASITIKGTTQGTASDEKGNFKITTALSYPLTLVISAINFTTKEIALRDNQFVTADLEASFFVGDVLVTASTRTPVRVLESPVSIETVSRAAIRNTPSPSYYDAIGTLKGVDITTSSFAFKTPSTRGFNGSGNLRFNQLVDGMDNQAPALNFAVGSIIGLTELDVESMELLPGASSALYGSGGMNGTLLINSKSPFKYTGLSFQIKQGVNHVDNYQRNPAPFYDWSLRWGKKVSEKFAFKIGAQFVQAQDWRGNDVRNLRRENVISSLKDGDRVSDPNYDGVNIFGDEASASMGAFAQAVKATVARNGGAAGITLLDQLIAGGLTPQQIALTFGSNQQLAPLAQFLPFLIPASTAANNPYRGTFGAQSVSRTGYDEKELVDYNAYNVRLSAGLNYMITKNIEASFLGYFGTGTSVYTGADRYSLKNLKMGQYKLELKSKNWFLRAYTTQENSGDSYTATTSAIFINRAWKSDATWFQQYSGTYAAAKLGLIPGATPGTFLPAFPDAVAHGTARSVAETGRYLPGSAQFKKAFQNAINTPIGLGGAKFADKSNLYHYEGQLNLTDYVKFAEVLVGASYRRFLLNSNGTIFADTTGKIGINEYGGYVQLQKKFIKEILKLSASVRYDKNQNFDGRFTPRFSALVKVAENNNIRLSYQAAYRFPSTQDQYINLLTGGSNRLVGGLPSFNTFFQFDQNPAYTSESIVAYRNSFATVPNPGLLKVAQFTNIKPETVKSYEIGYKALWSKKLLIDVYGYYSRYKKFLGRAAVGRGQSGIPARAPIDLASPFTTNNFSFVVNSTTPVKVIGYGIGIEYNLFKKYIANINAFSDRLQDVPTGLITFFNAPKYRYNLGLSNVDFYKGFGFNVNYRWQDKINWEGTFGSGEVPSYGTADAMLSYKFTEIKSMFKIGATNLGNKYYRSAFGNPQVGGLYYVGFAYNVF